MYFYFVSLLILTFIFCSNLQSWAQGRVEKVQSEIFQQLKRDEKREQDKKIRSNLIRDSKQKKRQKNITNIGPQFLIKRIVVGRSKLLSPKEIAQVTKKYEGKYLSIAELQLIIQDINKLYVEKKGALSRAVLPPQKIKNGIVKIILVESSLGKVIFENTKYTSQDYLRWALVIDKNKNLNFKNIENIFFKFNKLHRSMKVSSQLQPGDGFGETDILIKIKEAKRWSGGVFWDNEGSDSTGINRYGLNFQSISLFGFDDQAILGGSKSKGQKSGFLSYEFPFSPFGSRAKLIYSYSTQNIVDGAFADLNIKGSSSFLSTRITQNMLVNRFFSLDGFLEIVTSHSNSLLGGFKLENNTFKYSPGLFLNIYDSKGAWALDASFHQILKRGSTDGIPNDRVWYTKFPWSLSRYYVFTSDLTLSGKFSTQIVLDDELPASEHFPLGGLNNMAYHTAAFTGPRGHVWELRAEYDGILNKYTPSSLSFLRHKTFLALQRGSVKTMDDNSEMGNSGSVMSLSFGLETQISSYLQGELIFPLALAGSKERDVRSFVFALRGQF